MIGFLLHGRRRLSVHLNLIFFFLSGCIEVASLKELDGGDASGIRSDYEDDLSITDAGNANSSATENSDTTMSCEASECEQGQIQSQTEMCGMCGTRQRLGICSESCRWEWGEWSSCADTGQCSPGDTDEKVEACGECGGTWTLSGICSESCQWEWSEPSECIDKGVCSPGDTDEKVESCGECGGTWTLTGICSDSCQWEWSEPSECVESVECHPGDPDDTREVTCPCSGTKTQSRSCTSGCVWSNSWKDVSSCNVECCSEVVFCDTQRASDTTLHSDYPDRGTWCRRRSDGTKCSNEELESDCLADAESVCGGVTPELHIDY